jgi:hypothetical protein
MSSTRPLASASQTTSHHQHSAHLGCTANGRRGTYLIVAEEQLPHEDVAQGEAEARVIGLVDEL